MKEKREMLFSDAKTVFTKQLALLGKHSFIVKTQLSQKKHLQRKLAAYEVILHEDLSEN